ncbi:aspartate kinase [Natranaerovirga pectinivora]|uniref:aspartate kinase n=1 Tax=Natranaerovirga pectinivora TaxID=682400 RepID=A0A4R3MIE4_9FIRM|nr:ACT domain-containing protein [Natranaerovirga pectinivora]TCT13094.1 aspartate kinase [Natranaerovirga pectinivora]
MKPVITNLYITQNVTLITLINVPSPIDQRAKIFSALADAGINIDMVSQTTPFKEVINISFSLNDDDFFNAIQALKVFKSSIPDLRIEVNSNNTKISLFGEAMRHTTGVFAKALELLVASNVDVKIITTSESDISFLIYSSDEKKAINALTKHYNIGI